VIFLDTLGIFFGKTVAAENSTQTQTKKPKILTKKDPNMKQSIKLKTTTLLVIPLVLACFALLPRAQAATPELLPAPAPDGFYNGFNTAEGFGALFALTTGTFNTALGFKALNADTSGGSNTAVGGQALLHNNTGSFNTAIGENALVFNTGGSFNMALGQGALANNLTGNSNTAMGFQALNTNTTDNNTGVGFQALRSNVGGGSLTAIGFQTLSGNISGGSFSTAVGFQADQVSNNNSNDAFGYQSLLNVTTGGFNVAMGVRTLNDLIDGSFNTAIGNNAGDGLVHGSFNLFLGQGVFAGAATESFHTYIKNVYSTPTGLARIVRVLPSGLLGTFEASSRRFKDDIKPMDKASEVILALKPVTFHYKKEMDPQGTLMYGLVAEEVEKVIPEMVTHDEKGQIDGVRYESINMMVLNEFLKEHQKVQELEATVAQQKKGMELLAAQLKEQAALIQKVSAQVEMSKPAPTVVANQ